VEVLGLVDLALMGGLVVMVMFAGYENFISKFDLNGHKDRPDWMGHVDLSDIKLKLMASIVAISAIHVLEAFLNIDRNFDATRMTWLVAVHLVFVISTLMLALSDRLGNNSE
jgi:uncharacterized protein (TIGR00645 family)